jgi:hypothetical protein
MGKESFMNRKSSRFDHLVARYYPAVYSSAARLTDDPREAVALTREAFNARAKDCKAYVTKRLSRLSSSLQFYVRDLRPFDLSLVRSKFACAMLAVSAV